MPVLPFMSIFSHFDYWIGILYKNLDENSAVGHYKENMCFFYMKVINIQILNVKLLEKTGTLFLG